MTKKTRENGGRCAKISFLSGKKKIKVTARKHTGKIPASPKADKGGKPKKKEEENPPVAPETNLPEADKGGKPEEEEGDKNLEKMEEKDKHEEKIEGAFLPFVSNFCN